MIFGRRENIFGQVGGGGGGGAVNQNAFTDARVEAADKKIIFIRNGGVDKEVNLSTMLTAANTTFNPAPSGMAARDVQGAIEELKQNMSTLKDSNIYIVPDNQELQTFLGRTTLRTGDIVYVLDATDVVDHTGVGVDNDGKPVAMIYDDSLQQSTNKLRVFSKLDSKINLDGYAKLAEENFFIEKNKFNNLYLTAYDIFVGGDMPTAGGIGGFKKTGRRNYDSHALDNDVKNGGYVESLIIKVSQGMGLGHSTRVSAWEVEKGATKAQDVVRETLARSEEFEVFEHGTMGKCIEIPVKKSYKKPTYFIYQFDTTTDMAINNGGAASDDNIYYDSPVTDDLTDDIVHSASRNQYAGIYALTGVIDGTTIDVRDRIENAVYVWDDLDYARTREAYTFNNLLAGVNRNEGKSVSADGSLTVSANWVSLIFPVQYGKTYCFTNKVGVNQDSPPGMAGSSVCVEYNTANNTFDSSTKVANGSWSGGGKVNGRSYIKYKPTSQDVTHISISLYKGNHDTEEEAMIWDELAPPHRPYVENGTLDIPRAVILDGTKIETTFESTTGLTSKVVNEAIDELNSKSVKSWKDLNHANEYQFANLIEYDKKINGYWYGNSTNNGSHKENEHWSICEIPLEANQTYSILRKNNDQGLIVFFKDATYVNSRRATTTNRNGWYVDKFDTTDRINKVGISFQHRSGHNDTKEKMMLVKGDLSSGNTEFIPYSDGNLIQVGNQVSLGFNNSGTSIKSTTVESAIKELENKIVNSGNSSLVDSTGRVLNGEVIQSATADRVSLTIGGIEVSTIELMVEADKDIILGELR